MGVILDEVVPADSLAVGLASYLWTTKADIVRLVIGPPCLGKARMGRQPEQVTGL
jgi:hypothetical protein